jgi:hypothetical protein
LSEEDVINAAGDVILGSEAVDDESAVADEASAAKIMGARPRTISTLNPEQRRALIAERAHVTAVADTVEPNEVDPGALILLWRASNFRPNSAADDRRAWMLINRPDNARLRPVASATGLRTVPS